MALMEDLVKGGGVPGIAVGVAVAVLAPVLLPMVSRVLRPAAKAMVKTGMSVYRETRRGITDATGDLIAEAKSEMAADMGPMAAARTVRRGAAAKARH
ncbi:MAG TPA: DUF5132 domain-containing protein [Stellaceae bacterium]|nr:DUF5132 domain-containing protein [Stellaceae bacterium]